MKAILKARSRRPKGAKFYLGVVHVDGDEKDVARRWFKCHRTAGGVAFKYRGWGGEDYRWRNVIVAFSDSRQAMVKAGLRCVQRMRDRMAVTYFLARHLRYPRAWDQNRPVLALKSLAREYAKVKGVTRYRSYGACTDLYVPGMSWCDFTGYETKGTDQPG